MKKESLKEFLDEKAEFYENKKFVGTDPIQIPHQFSKKEDIEISAFLVATIAWGNRTSIINNGTRLMQLMDHSPSDFILNHTKSDLSRFDSFVHRTFNGEDAKCFMGALQNIYRNHGGLEALFSLNNKENRLQEAIHNFKQVFFSVPHLARTEKHVSDPLKNSAAKRINMYLRWMVRDSKKGVDFGLWNSLKPSQLSCPLDVHTGNVARKLGLLDRHQNDAKALEILDDALREMDPIDPVKYDFALFGLGAFEKF
ncbi:MAG: TIGR02757 family protein [Flavobacteriaceae bacterium]|nr:TIGR02757 family protein [Flavobacteriaceae bacterium]